MIWLLTATIRVSAILLIAFLLARLLRKRAASLRHAAILFGVTCAAIAPLLGAVIPSWVAPGITMPSVLQRLSIPDLPAVPGNANAGSLSGAGSVPVLQMETVAEPAALPAGPAPTDSFHQAQRILPRILDTAWIVYLVGLVVSLAALAMGLLRLFWMSARSVPMRNVLWQRQAAAIAASYGLQRTVRLARSPHPVLAVWGFARPQVLLPAGAEDWPEDRIRAVLLHEFAHIRRNDWLVQVLAGTLRAIYWFNPLLWLACACLQQESEHACDDDAIEQGADKTEYAAHLLAVARAFMQTPSQLVPAPSMARRSTLLRRVADILDPATIHARASRRSVARIVAPLLVATLAIAACQIRQPPLHGLAARTHEAAAKSRDTPARVSLASSMKEVRPAVTPQRAGVLRDPGARSGTAPLQAIAAAMADIAPTTLADGDSGQSAHYVHLPGSADTQRMVEAGSGDPAGVTYEGAAPLIADGLPAPAASAAISLPDRSRPPAVVPSTGGFTMRRLAAPVVIDGRLWNAVNAIWGGTTVAPNRQFAVSLSNRNEAGDAARYRITYSDIGSQPIPLTAGIATYAWVTPDSRWIFFGDLHVIDVRTWRQYELSRQFGIASYAVPKAISSDGRRLVLSRSSCPFDCGNAPAQYYELEFPDPAE